MSMNAHQENLLTGANIPKRHLRNLKFQKPKGPWVEVGIDIFGKLNTGFTYALIGKSGTGKSQLGANLAYLHIRDHEHSARFCTAREFFLDIKASFKSSEQSERDVIQHYCTPNFLVIDEYDKRGETTWEDGLVDYLINKRYELIKDTLIISNQTQEQFEKQIGPATLSRINETGGLIVCDWPSFREGAVCG